MEGGIEKRLRSIEKTSNLKARVIDAAKEATTEVALTYNLGPTNAGHVDRAVENILLNYQSTGDHEVLTDLKNMAFDAADDVFRSLGFDQPDLAQDFMAKMDEVLSRENA